MFKANLPGLKKEEVKVEIEDNKVLQISAERKVEKEDKNDKWHRVERSSGKFLRRFRACLVSVFEYRKWWAGLKFFCLVAVLTFCI